MRLICALFIAFVLASCGPAIYVDYDEEIDFTELRSYEFHPNFESGLNELDNKRIMRAIDSIMVQRGFIKTDYCQYYISFFADEQLEPSRNTLGIGIGGGGRNGGLGVSGGIPIGGNVVNQRLVIDIIGAYMDAPLVWQATIDGELKEKSSPAQKEAYYQSVIQKAFKKFPPKK